MEEYGEMIFKMRDEIYELLMNDNITIKFNDCYSEDGFTHASIVYKGFVVTVFSNQQWGIDKTNFLFKKLSEEKYEKWRYENCV